MRINDYKKSRAVNSVKPKSSNPFSAFFTRIEEKRKIKREDITRRITNDRAHNEEEIKRTLNAINFVDSKLPADELARTKVVGDCKMSEMEYAVRALITKIDSPSNFPVDTSEFDLKLLMLAEDFKHAVANGESSAAKAARNGLIRCISDIRERIPNLDAERAQNFVKEGINYATKWLQVVDINSKCDQQEKNVKNIREKLDADKADLERLKDEFEKEVFGDKEHPEKLSAFMETKDQVMPSDPSKAGWTPLQCEIRTRLINNRLQEDLLEFDLVDYNKRASFLNTQRHEAEKVYNAVINIPIAEGRFSMQDYEDTINELFAELIETDAKIDAALKKSEEFSGRLADLKNAPGSLRERDIASEQAKKMVEDYKKKQNNAGSGGQKNVQEMLKELGIRTEEEQEEYLKEQQAKRVAEEEKIMEYIDNVEVDINEQEEDEENYN